MSINDHQPAPVANDKPAVWDLVIEDVEALARDLKFVYPRELLADMRERDQVGRARYGVPLQAHNGRDSLVDAYQESLDLVVYLRQAEEEGYDVKPAYAGALKLASMLRTSITKRDAAKKGAAE